MVPHLHLPGLELAGFADSKLICPVTFKAACSHLPILVEEHAFGLNEEQALAVLLLPWAGEDCQSVRGRESMGGCGKQQDEGKNADFSPVGSASWEKHGGESPRASGPVGNELIASVLWHLGRRS
jgi:hypothetical protein